MALREGGISSPEDWVERGRCTFRNLFMSPVSKSGVGGVDYDGKENWLILSIHEISYLLVAVGAEVNIHCNCCSLSRQVTAFHQLHGCGLVVFVPVVGLCEECIEMPVPLGRLLYRDNLTA